MPSRVPKPRRPLESILALREPHLAAAETEHISTHVTRSRIPCLPILSWDHIDTSAMPAAGREEEKKVKIQKKKVMSSMSHTSSCSCRKANLL